MIPIEDFVAELAELDVRLSVDGERLRCSAPDEVMNSGLQARLAERKPELVAFLAGLSERARPELDLVRGSHEGDIPLSPGQERIRSLADLRPDSTLYNISTAFRLKGALDLPALERSLSAIQSRHEILRTSFPEGETGPRQFVHAATPVALPLTDVLRDLRHLPAERREPEIHQLLQAEMQTPFDISAGPLWRCRLYRTAKKEHVLSFTMHHIIFDGRSKPVFLKELAEFYRAFSSGTEPEIGELPVQYSDYTLWHNRRLGSDAQQRQLASWQRKLAGDIAPLALPNDHPRGASAPSSQSEMFEMPPALAKSLASLGSRERASLFAVLLTGFAVCLNRYCGQQDLVISSPMACRDRAELEPMIGYFNNISAMRADLSGDPDMRTLIGRIRQTTLDALDNQNLPFQTVAALPNLARVSLTRGMFSYQDASSRALDLPGLAATPIDIRKAEADFEIALYMESSASGELSGILEYDAGLFEAATIRQLVEDFKTVLEAMVANSAQRLGGLPRFGTDPADIQAALAAHAQIDEALVVPLPDAPGLAAYLVLNEHDVPDLDDIRRFVRAGFTDYCVPLAFVPLDEMPLAADGSVDRSALPLPMIIRGRPADTPYVAPRTELEKRLAAVWKKVLWLDQDVGIQDRFSDLGGHSLLAVQLVLALEQEMQRDLPVRALLRLGTIAEMAEILDRDPDTAEPDEDPAAVPHHLAPDVYRGLQTYTATWEGHRTSPDSLIVGMNMEGERPTLFWCLQRYGELTQLAKHLGSDQPVFGMRSGNSVMVKTQDNINALAAHYADEILAAQPQGPYVVGGNCQAAKIAFQVARQLRERGHEITILMLMEKFVPQACDGRIAMLYGIDSHRNPTLNFKDPMAGWAKYYSGPLTLDLVAGRHSQFFKEPNIQDLAATIRRRMDEAAADTGSVSAASKTDRQQLPETAYRAGLRALGAPSGEPGASVRMRVEVTNLSSTLWRRHEDSGIYLAGRWFNRKGKPFGSSGATAALVRDLNPGETTTLDLPVTLPNKQGRYSLELDLVDDGVVWFSEEGSEPARLNLHVGGRSIISNPGTWWQNFTIWLGGRST
jgi:thioesterase domain-containing protein/acyl carrier protein